MSSDPLARRATAVRALLLGLTWILLTGLLIASGELVAHSEAIAHFDAHITSSVVAHRTPALDTMMKIITWAGSWVAVAVTGGIFLVLVAIRRLPLTVLILAAVAWVGEVSSVNIAKGLVDRQRPPQIVWLVSAHGGSFPSGHAANATLVFTNLAFVSLLLIRLRTARVATSIGAVLAVAAVGFSRAELGVHWTTDVIASVLVVGAWLAATACLFAPYLPMPSYSSPVKESAEWSDRSELEAATDSRSAK